ncbi:MAG: HAD-IIIA family hydrolase [Bacteroidetes bacterium]|nr:HAD-IIIA family hydrolase [Bacteroidota bacterium]
MSTSFSLKSSKFRFRSKVAAFDLDWTLIKPKSGGTFPKNDEDWIWLRPNVLDILKEYYDKGYCIIIITNQSKESKMPQMQLVFEAFTIPVMMIVLRNKEDYKPSLKYVKEVIPIEKIKTKTSFFCGDALGRPNDWSDTDKLFAENLKIKTRTPEDVFPFEKNVATNLFHNSKEQEIIIMVGYPGSGKSSFVETQFSHDNQYVILHGDELKTTAKIIKLAKTYISKGKSVVIDATNASKDKRKLYIDLAQEHNIQIRCVHVNTSYEEALYRNNNRERPVPKIVYNVYKKHFQEPKLEEGFKDVYVV